MPFRDHEARLERRISERERRDRFHARPERIENSKDLISLLLGEKESRPPPPADGSSGARVACVSRMGTENNETTNNGPWHAFLQLLFLEKNCGGVGKRAFFLSCDSDSAAGENERVEFLFFSFSFAGSKHRAH